jgi:TPR repeat protein
MRRRFGVVSGPLAIFVASAIAAGGIFAADESRTADPVPSESSPFGELCRDAQKGNAKAQYVLGCCYNGDHGIQKDPAKAALWWGKAAAQGVADAQYFLGLCYYVGDGVPKDTTVATTWWRKAAEQDHADAQYFLGLSYNTGTGVPKSVQQAVYWLKKSASLGNQEALELLRQFGPSPG